MCFSISSMCLFQVTRNFATFKNISKYFPVKITVRNTARNCHDLMALALQASGVLKCGIFLRLRGWFESIRELRFTDCLDRRDSRLFLLFSAASFTCSWERPLRTNAAKNNIGLRPCPQRHARLVNEKNAQIWQNIPAIYESSKLYVVNCGLFLVVTDYSNHPRRR